MRKIFSIAAICLMMIVSSCSKRYHPSGSATTITPIHGVSSAKAEKPRVSELITPSETEEKKPVAVVKPKTKDEDIPKVITVNDAAAHKSVDGRYYYDVLGHRYWRNNKDGKYYLFDKSMYTNSDFKKQN